MSKSLHELANNPCSRVLDSLRDLEKKSGLVFTFFKASVYAIVMQNEQEAFGNNEDEDGGTPSRGNNMLYETIGHGDLEGLDELRETVVNGGR